MPSRLRFVAFWALCFGFAVVQVQGLVTNFLK
jgi:hypothetical protein